jgi:hypothetical protein
LVLRLFATARVHARRIFAPATAADQRWITNLRLNFIHRPGSDLYLVFNDDHGEEGAPGRLTSRGFAVKALVFPLGMYSVGTFMLEKATGLAPLRVIPALFVYPALLAWALTLAGLLRALASHLAKPR